MDRLTSAQNTATTGTSAKYANLQGCWSYDAYGNRTAEELVTGSGFSNAPGTQCQAQPNAALVQNLWATYNSANNRIATTNLGPTTATAGVFQYDASGNTTYDGINRYWYDAEGTRIGKGAAPAAGSPPPTMGAACTTSWPTRSARSACRPT